MIQNNAYLLKKEYISAEKGGIERVLVVDDEENIAEVVSLFLKSKGYFVSTAKNGEDALKILKEDYYDLVISDIRMPKMDGLALLKEINKLSRNSIKIGEVLYVPAQSIDPSIDPPDSIGKSEEVVTTMVPIDGSESNEVNVLSDFSGDYVNHTAALLIKNEGSGSDTEKEDNWLSVIDTAMDYLGVPYRFGGSSLKGIDCSAFVQRVYKYFSIDLPRTAREQFKAGVKVSKKDDLRIGDLIFFRTYARFPSHVGIYIGEGKMIHASSRDKKVTITSINEPYYVRRYIGAIRLPDNPTKISQEGITSITPN